MNTTLFSAFGVDWTVAILLIPVFSGVIGYGTNWVGIKMMFYPLEFVGWRLPWTVFGVPIIGWQGMIPNRVTKLASLAVDTGLAKLGTMSEFIKEMEPEVIAAYVAEQERAEVRRVIDEVLREKYPGVWSSLPGPAKETLYVRVEADLPEALRRAIEHMGDNVDRLLDVKLMVVRFLEAEPEVFNKLIKRVATDELNFVIRSGFLLGLPLGIGPMLVYAFLTQHWAAVPIGAGIVGWLTNYIALKLIFYPAAPKKFGPIKLHGLMMRRKADVGHEYAQIFAHDLLTAPKIVDRMLNGPGGDRTRQLIADTITPIIERNAGAARHLVRIAAGKRYEEIPATVADTAVDMAPDFITQHAHFIQQRQDKLARLIGRRMGELDWPDFQRLMRSPFEQDEWIAIMVGALLGFGAGVLQVAVTLGGL